MLAWQYQQLDFKQLPPRVSEIDALNRAGEDGWELVAITVNNLAILKRQTNGSASERSVAKPGRAKERT